LHLWLGNFPVFIPDPALRSQNAYTNFVQSRAAKSARALPSPPPEGQTRPQNNDFALDVFGRGGVGILG
jgi:hypothetical protein